MISLMLGRLTAQNSRALKDLPAPPRCDPTWPTAQPWESTKMASLMLMQLLVSAGASSRCLWPLAFATKACALLGRAWIVQRCWLRKQTAAAKMVQRRWALDAAQSWTQDAALVLEDSS